MELLLKNSPNTYDTNDVVVIMPDGQVWGSEEYNIDKFTIVTGVTLTDAETAKLKMVDEQANSISAIGQLPTFRSISTSRANSKFLHRRKYKYDNGVILKDNAQVK